MGRQVVIPQYGGVGVGDDGASACTRESAGALDAHDKKDGAYWSAQLVGDSRRRQVSRFWLEKVAVLTDAGQLFALMWQLSQPWPWPARWLSATRWVNAFNLDIMSFRASGAAMGATNQPFSLWGEMPYYWLYALLWALVPWSAIAALQFAKRSWYLQGRSDFLVRGVEWENVLLQALQFLYLPVGLAVLRLVNCDADGSVSVDPTSMGTCWGLGHLTAVLGITCGLGGVLLLGLPWILHRCIQDPLTQSSAEKHERFLQGKELEYMLGTSDAYLELFMPQYASYKRRSVGFPVQLCLLKLALLVVFSVLRSPAPETTNQGLQGNLFFLLMTALAVRRSWRYPYRCLSTSRLAMVADWMLVANGVFVLLCANGVRSALTVSTAVYASLVFLNACFLSVMGIMGLRTLQLWAWNRLDNNGNRVSWPVNEHMDAVIGYGPVLGTWVQAIKETQRTILKVLLVTPSMRPHEELRSVLGQLEVCCKEAAEADHLLLDQLYELSLYVNELYIEAVASNPFQRIEFPEQELSSLKSVMQRRSDRQVLLSLRNQRVLTKLEVVKNWSRPPHSRSGVVEPLEKHCVTSIQGFLEDSMDLHHEAVAREAEWEVVNSLFRLTQDHSSSEDNEAPAILMEVKAWIPVQGLVKGCIVNGAFATKGDQTIVFTVAQARAAGIRGELVSSDNARASADILQALRADAAEASYGTKEIIGTTIAGFGKAGVSGDH